MHVDLIGVPLDFGAGRRGVDMGPSAIRYAGLHPTLEAMGARVTDLGNVSVPVREACDEGDVRLRYLHPILSVQRALADAVAASLKARHIPLVLGGDHSLSAGSVAGAARGRRLGLVWLDAHGDFNTDETTGSGNIHGMPLAALCGLGDERLVTLDGQEPPGPRVMPAHVAIVGVRDLDRDEKRLLREAGVTVFSMEEVDRLGIVQVMRRAIEVASTGTDGLYVSLDLDVIDPATAPGVGTPVAGGLTYREAHLAVEMLAETGAVVGLDVVEVNPILDRVNATGELAVQLAASALGKRIW